MVDHPQTALVSTAPPAGAGGPLSEPRPLWPPGLTAAERGVLHLLTAGCSNKEIASALGKAEPTIKHQVSSILQKAGVQSRTQLVVRMLRHWPAAQ